ncbi:hypothetical protein T265_07460 [Opisthorchis viverrini]|uniref:Uncharacterized protein n=1 Tax=Opisthorchis viverrini TaxID=6198 RepID=A0A074ZCV2_OPIVI|nr:hypothetical protein T265_07460 [Opisthorchis viverrini]KER25008.1 hypothetical protein T265_07460 [Opisthorchis viverrini]
MQQLECVRTTELTDWRPTNIQGAYSSKTSPIWMQLTNGSNSHRFIIIIIIIDSMTSVFNTDASLPYNHDLFESLIFICVCAIHGCTWAGILPGRPYLDRRTIKVLNQSLWLKSLTARQRCLAGNANALPFLRNKSPHVPTPNLEGHETVFVRPLTIDQPGVRDSVSVAGHSPV